MCSIFNLQRRVWPQVGHEIHGASQIFVGVSSFQIIVIAFPQTDSTSVSCCSYYGGIIPSILNVLSMQGYLILGSIIGGQTLASASPHLNATTGIVITSLISLAVSLALDHAPIASLPGLLRVTSQLTWNTNRTILKGHVLRISNFSLVSLIRFSCLNACLTSIWKV